MIGFPINDLLAFFARVVMHDFFSLIAVSEMSGVINWGAEQETMLTRYLPL